MERRIRTPTWATTGRAGSVVDVAVATLRRFVAQRMNDGAAALSFYVLFSMIPSLLIFSAVVRLIGSDAVASITSYARESGASAALTEALRSVLHTALQAAPEGASAVGLVGLATLVYGASKAFTAAGRGLDVVAGAETPRRTLVRRAEDVAWTVVLLVLVTVLLGLVFLTGTLFQDLFGAIGLSHVGALTWNLARWPLAFALGMVIVGLVVYAAPSRRPAFRPWTPGTVFTVAAFLLASAGYGIYVGNIASYNATYGTFAAIVILMLWVWIASMAFLFGAELDAELDARHGPRPPGRRAGGAPARDARAEAAERRSQAG